MESTGEIDEIGYKMTMLKLEYDNYKGEYKQKLKKHEDEFFKKIRSTYPHLFVIIAVPHYSQNLPEQHFVIHSMLCAYYSSYENANKYVPDGPKIKGDDCVWKYHIETVDSKNLDMTKLNAFTFNRKLNHSDYPHHDYFK
jgi:hypothetical protein